MKFLILVFLIFCILCAIVWIIRKFNKATKSAVTYQTASEVLQNSDKKIKQVPPMIRVLPMDRKSEFEDMPITEVQKGFFLKDLPCREDKYGKGKFLFRKSALSAKPGTIVLFQYDNRIIALAELTNIVKFEKPQLGVDTSNGCSDNKEEYSGAYYFDPNTIKTFQPIGSDEIKSIWGEDGFIDSDGKEHKGFKGFGQTKWFLDPEEYSNFYQLLKNVGSPENKG